MASILNLSNLNPKNQPIEILSDSTDSLHTLIIKDITNTITYFTGNIIKNPNEVYTGIDIQPYLPKPNQTDIDFDNLVSKTLPNFYIGYSVKIYNASSVLVYDDIVYVANYSVKFTDWLRLKDSLPIGRLRTYLNNVDMSNRVVGGEYYKGQTEQASWSGEESDLYVTKSTFPLTEEGYSIMVDSAVATGIYKARFKTNLPVDNYITKFDAKATGTNCKIYVANERYNTGSLYSTFTSYYAGIQTSANLNSSAIEFVINHTQGVSDKITIKNVAIVLDRNIVTPFQNDDWVLNNFIYTFCDTYVTTNRVWNKSLKGAPLFTIVSNTSQFVNNDIYFGYTTYRTKDSVDTRYSNDSVGNIKNTAVLYRIPEVSTDYVSIDIYNEIIDYNRSIYIELLNPNCIKGNAYQLYWENSRGGIDWIVMAGTNTKKIKVNKSTINYTKRKFSNSKFVGTSNSELYNNYNTEVESTIQLNSVFLDDDQYEYLEDLFYSKNVWLWDSKTGDIVKVKLVDTEYTHKKYFNDKISNITINVELPYTDYL